MIQSSLIEVIRFINLEDKFEYQCALKVLFLLLILLFCMYLSESLYIFFNCNNEMEREENEQLINFRKDT